MVLTEDPMLRGVLDVVVDHINPRRVILFGSRARGDERPDSDYDLMIVEDEPGADVEPAIARVGAIYVDFFDRLHPDCGPVDLLLYSQSEVDQWRGSRCNVIGIAHHEGRVVYERDR